MKRRRGLADCPYKRRQALKDRYIEQMKRDKHQHRYTGRRADYSKVRKHKRPENLNDYTPSEGGPLNGSPHPDPAYHDLVRKLYRRSKS